MAQTQNDYSPADLSLEDVFAALAREGAVMRMPVRIIDSPYSGEADLGVSTVAGVAVVDGTVVIIQGEFADSASPAIESVARDITGEPGPANEGAAS